MSPPCRIPYKSRRTVGVTCGLFFGLGSAILGFTAATNTRGIIINGILTLSPQAATVFYWALFGFAAFFALVGLKLLFVRGHTHAFLELTPDALLIPRGFSGKHRRVPYTEILHISELSVTGSKSLGLRTATGQYWIASSILARSEDYRELKDFLTQITQSSHQPNAGARPQLKNPIS